MPEGAVGSGHQNSWKRDGWFLEKSGSKAEPVGFKKGIVNIPTDRNQSECWSAGTPIRYNDGPLLKNEDGTIKVRENNVRPTNAYVGNVEMLVSTNAEGKTEYHPLITFFNEVMATILNEDKTMLQGIDTPEEAIRVWEFLKKTYNCSGKIQDRVSMNADLVV